MSQTSIDTFFKSRKRPASEMIHSGKSITRKLFAQDDDPTSPVSSPVRQILIREDERAKDSGSHEESGETSGEPPTIDTPTRSAAQPERLQKFQNPGDSEKAGETSEELPEVRTPTRSATEQEVLQKELNLGEFKKVIRQSKKYTTLKTALEKHNATVSHLKTIEQSRKNLPSSPDLKAFNNVKFEVNCSPVKQGNLKPKKLFANNETSRSPMKTQSYVSPRKFLNEGFSPIKVSAQEQYIHLVASKDSLTLPLKYKTLKEIFNGVETVVRILTNRKELITFRRILGDVQKMTRRNFTEQHLGMIKTVYPEAYKLKYEFVKLPFTRDETLELIIEIPASHSTEMTERKKMFHKLLLERTKLHHQEFLKTLDPPLIVAIDQIRRWHPLYDLNTVPDIPAALIPRPATNKEAPASVKDFLEKTRELVSCNKRMERAVSQLIGEKSASKVDEKTELKNESTVTSSPVVNPIPAFEKAMKGVPKSLLEKIRAKKAAKMVQAITQTSEEATKQAMKSRLPELAKSMRFLFVSEKKNSLPLTKVSERFKDKLSTADLVEHLKLISEAVPGWLTIFNNLECNEQYVRLSKDADISRIVGKLRTIAGAP